MKVQGMRIEQDTDHLVIRSATQEDADVLTNWWNDGAVMAHAGFPLGLGQSVEETRRQIAENETHLSQRCIIEYQGIRIGEMSYSILEHAAEIGIKICETSYQNQGLGTRLLQMLIEYLFHDETLNTAMRIDKIILDTNLKNLRAQHVYETIGFQKLAVNYGIWRDQLGQVQDGVDYELTRAQYEDGVRYITDPAVKEQIASRVLYALPEWFGLPESTKGYIEESKANPFFAYYRDNQYVGFIVLKETGPVTAELCVMGILKEYHRYGIGSKLFAAFYEYARQKKYEFLQVKTVDAGCYEEYDISRMFYEKMGFKKLEVFPTLWDEWNPCLVMVMAIKENEISTPEVKLEKKDISESSESAEFTTVQPESAEIELVEVPKESIDHFWNLHLEYLKRDIFPEESTDAASREEDLAYFQSEEYRGLIVKYMDRRPDQAHLIYFMRDGVRIGCCHYIIYKSEDGKCLLMDYWVLPKYRGNGTGHACFDALSSYVKKDQAAYIELNVASEKAHNFWASLNFVDDGIDEYGDPLMKLKF